jgi:precorrin-3B synthase
VAVARGDEVNALIALAHWFVETGGPAAGRMARHKAPLPRWAAGTEPPAPAGSKPEPGRHPLGAAYGLAFGRIEAQAFAGLIETGTAKAVRITPWRIAIVEGGSPTETDGFLNDFAAPALRADACPGKPFCPQATVETRALATHLAPHIRGSLHVSGCAKGCARARPAGVALTGRDGRFELAFDARAGDHPTGPSLSHAEILEQFGAA